MKLTQQATTCMVWGCSYNQVSLVLITYTLFVCRLSQLVPNFVDEDFSLISMVSCVVWPSSL